MKVSPLVINGKDYDSLLEMAKVKVRLRGVVLSAAFYQWHSNPSIFTPQARGNLRRFEDEFFCTFGD